MKARQTAGFQQSGSGNVIGMRVRVNSVDEFGLGVLTDLQVSVDLKVDGVDEDGFTRFRVGEQVGVSGRVWVKELLHFERW